MLSTSMPLGWGAMIATQTGASCRRDPRTLGDVGVNFSRNLLGIAASLPIAAALCGCGNLGLDSDQPWFRKPLFLTGQTGGYTFSDTQQARQDRPITANDLVSANGSCPPPSAMAQPAPGGASPAAAPAAAPDGSSMLGEPVGLGMSECDVVWRAGAPGNVELGQSPNGDRTAVLTYQSGSRPGIYRFVGGRLTEMNSVAQTAAPPPVAKKKPAKTKKPPGSNNAA